MNNPLTEIKNQIATCFSTGRLIFAALPENIKAAEDIRAYAAANNITLQQMETIAIEYMQSQNCTADHIDEQSAEVRTFFRKSLTDATE